MNAMVLQEPVSKLKAFAFTLVPGLRRPERSLPSGRDQGTALLVFLLLGPVEEAAVSHAGWFNERTVAISAAGLVAGRWAGLAVSLFVAWLAVVHDSLRQGSIAKRFEISLESPEALRSPQMGASLRSVRHQTHGIQR
jgi:hypothetical protein